jgi:uncharacterized protein YuzE
MAAVKLKRKSRAKAIEGARALAQIAKKFPANQLLLDYDEEVDVLYITFERPRKATHTVEYGDGSILLRYQKKELIGITVLFASTQ